MTEDLGKSLYRLTVNLRLVRPPKPDKEKLSEREIMALFLIRFLGTCPVEQLRRRLDVPMNTASTYIRRLADKEFIGRSFDSKDARIHLLQLTKRGESFLEKLEEMRGHRMDTYIGELALTGAEETSLRRVLKKANDLIENQLRTRIRRTASEESNVPPATLDEE